MVHNLTLVWADKYTTVSKSHNKCLGIAQGLIKTAKKEFAETDRKAIDNERHAIAARGQSQTAAPITAAPISAPTNTVKAVQKNGNHFEEDSTAEWRSMQQLTIFRDNAKTVAEAILTSKARHMLGRYDNRECSITDHDAYNQGREDSKKIDVRGSRCIQSGS